MPAPSARPLILGHRGAPLVAPENTLLAYRRAAERGADGVELDVQRSADGALPLLHDDRVDRATDGRVGVGDLPWAALAALDAGGGERIPTLEDALAFAATVNARRPFFLNIELKMPGVGPDTLAALARVDYRGPLALSSFDYPTLEETRRRDGAVELWLLADAWDDDLPRRARAVAATCLALEHYLLDPATVAAATAAGLGVVAWTADAPADIRRLLALGPALRALISNVPDIALAERESASWGG
ncbi:MAG TPA: glycerophosphodiester phosphodiesterase [Thermomicrobiales bacterium]|nr:glycerophosphodiester phosphodiesterase [Thermomicrobiales bacterium]